MLASGETALCLQPSRPTPILRHTSSSTLSLIKSLSDAHHLYVGLRLSSSWMP
jgi:hypothetical protein